MFNVLTLLLNIYKGIIISAYNYAFLNSKITKSMYI